MNTKNRIQYKMPNAEYQAAPGVSNTMLSAMARSPAHCYALHISRDRPPHTPTPAMLAGTLEHGMILEPHNFGANYIAIDTDAPKYPTKAQWNARKPSPETTAAVAWWAEFNKRANGRTPVTFAQISIAIAQREAVVAVLALRDLLGSSFGVAEQSIFWTDPATGLQCRARPDWMTEAGAGVVDLLDLKTTQDASPEAFSKTVAKYGYHRQAAHYTAGVEQASGLKVGRFVFAVVTASYPFLAAAYVLDAEAIQQGEDERAELLHQYAECQRTGKWPAYGDVANVIGLPVWARRSSEIEVSYV